MGPVQTVLRSNCYAASVCHISYMSLANIYPGANGWLLRVFIKL